MNSSSPIQKHFLLQPILYAGCYFFSITYYQLLACTVPPSSPLPVAPKLTQRKEVAQKNVGSWSEFTLTGHTLGHDADGLSARTYTHLSISVEAQG